MWGFCVLPFFVPLSSFGTAIMNAGAAGAGSGECAAPKYRYTAPLSDAPRAGPGACDPGSRLVARRGRQEPRSTAVPLPGDTQGWYVRTRRSRRHCSPSAGPLLLLARAPPAPSLSVYPAARAPRHRAELRHQELEPRPFCDLPAKTKQVCCSFHTSFSSHHPTLPTTARGIDPSRCVCSTRR